MTPEAIIAQVRALNLPSAVLEAEELRRRIRDPENNALAGPYEPDPVEPWVGG